MKLFFLTWTAARQRDAWILLLYFASYYLEKHRVASHGLPFTGGLLLPPPPSCKGGGEGRFAACSFLHADFLLSIPLLTRLLEGGLETVLLSSSCLLYLYANFLLLMQYQLDFFVSACSRVCYRHIKVPVGCGPCRKLGWAGDCCCVTRSGEVRKPGSGLSSCAG